MFKRIIYNGDTPQKQPLILDIVGNKDNKIAELQKQKRGYEELIKDKEMKNPIDMFKEMFMKKSEQPVVPTKPVELSSAPTITTKAPLFVAEKNKNKMFAISDDEKKKVIATIFSEALGESPEGRQGVLNTIINRAKSGYGKSKTIFDVVSQPYQYTGFSGSNPLYVKARDYLRGKPVTLSPQEKLVIDEIMNLYLQAESGQLEDITGGNINYLNPATATDTKYFNKRNPKKDIQIGQHIFWGY